MLSLLKKKSASKSSFEVAPTPWRPDFRNVEALPDIKTVRTSFFFNTTTVAITAALLLYVVQREWTAFSLSRSLADLESRIATAEPASKKAVDAYALFQAEEKKFREAQVLAKDSFRLSDLFLELGDTLPEGVRLGRLDLRGPAHSVLLGGSVTGVDVAASARVSQYEKALQEDPRLAEWFAPIILTNVGRNAATSTLDFEILMTFKKPDAKAAGGRK